MCLQTLKIGKTIKTTLTNYFILEAVSMLVELIKRQTVIRQIQVKIFHQEYKDVCCLIMWFQILTRLLYILNEFKLQVNIMIN